MPQACSGGTLRAIGLKHHQDVGRGHRHALDARDAVPGAPPRRGDAGRGGAMSEKRAVAVGTCAPPRARPTRPSAWAAAPARATARRPARATRARRPASGGHVRPGFEGGQMPFIRRVPKRGFTNPSKVRWQIVSLEGAGGVRRPRGHGRRAGRGGRRRRAPTVGVKLLADGDVAAGTRRARAGDVGVRSPQDRGGRRPRRGVAGDRRRGSPTSSRSRS